MRRLSKSLSSIGIALFFLSNQAIAQLEFTIDMHSDSMGWGIYVRPDTSYNPSENVLPLSGQVSVVFSAVDSVELDPVISHAGFWLLNSTVRRPIENPNYDYMDFGYTVGTFPSDGLSSGNETLLFTIPKTFNCPDTIFLFENNSDPFNPPNSAGNNPGQNFPIRDLVSGGSHDWSRNYGDCPVICAPCALELTSSTESDPKIYNLEIFPNPSSGFFTYTGNRHNFSGIEVYNSIGVKVFEENNPSPQINLTQLPSGTYYLAFVTESGGRTTEQIFIQH